MMFTLATRYSPCSLNNIRMTSFTSLCIYMMMMMMIIYWVIMCMFIYVRCECDAVSVYDGAEIDANSRLGNPNNPKIITLVITLIALTITQFVYI